jgi:hypothetical protein
MVPAVFRRDSAPRFRLSDILALVFMSAVAFGVVFTNSHAAGVGAVLGVMFFVGISWLISIYVLSSAGVGNCFKRIVFIVLLPCSIAVCAMWLVLKTWLASGLTGNESVTWRTALSAATLAAAIIPIRRINDWVASVDSYYDVQLPARMLQRDQ